LRRLDEILDGKPMELPSTEIPAKHALPPSLVGQGRRALTAFPERSKTGLSDRERRQAAPFGPDPLVDAPSERERSRVAPFGPDPLVDAPSEREPPRVAPGDPDPSREASSSYDWWGRSQ
jgi:hypothetical protein